MLALQASGIARRRTEEERAEALCLCERRRRRRTPRAMREQRKRKGCYLDVKIVCHDSMEGL
jgi:hypothetical protein